MSSFTAFVTAIFGSPAKMVLSSNTNSCCCPIPAKYTFISNLSGNLSASRAALLIKKLIIFCHNNKNLLLVGFSMTVSPGVVVVALLTDSLELSAEVEVLSLPAWPYSEVNESVAVLSSEV